MKEIVWVFGNSAAGKETFIRHMLTDESMELREKLGWQDLLVTASQASLKYIGQFDNDPVTQKRDEILEEVPELLTRNDVVLIKWQTVDSQAGRIDALLQTMPDVSQRIIYLDTSKETLVERLPRKSWWDDDDIEGFIDEETAETRTELQRLAERFSVLKITSSDDAGYKIL